MDTCLPLQWWTDEQLAACAAPLEVAAAQWCAAWGVSEPLAVDCRRAHEANADLVSGWRWVALGPACDAGAQAWLGSTDGAEQILSSAIFGRSSPRPSASADLMSAQLIRAAWRDLHTRLATVCLPAISVAGSEAGANPSLGQAWSGAVVVTATAGPLAFAMHLNCSCAAALAGAAGSRPAAAQVRTALSSLKECLHDQRIQVRVELSAVELDLGGMRSLAVGDVVQLPHLLDQPLQVRLAGDDDTLCFAYLGARNGRRAVELAPAPVTHFYNESELS